MNTKERKIFFLKLIWNDFKNATTILYIECQQSCVDKDAVCINTVFQGMEIYWKLVDWMDHFLNQRPWW